MEDLHEAEVLWPEERCYRKSQDRLPVTSSLLQRKQQQKPPTGSAPIGIPTSNSSAGPWSFHVITSNGAADDREEDDEALGGEGSDSSFMVPPHLLLAARRTTRRYQKMAFSLCTGQGRTLKGRDLSEVRNLVLRLTGFLEAEGARNDQTAG